MLSELEKNQSCCIYVGVFPLIVYRKIETSCSHEIAKTTKWPFFYVLTSNRNGHSPGPGPLGHGWDP